MSEKAEKSEKNHHLLAVALFLLLLTSQVASVRAQEETTTTSARWRYEYNKNSYFGGPFLGVWVEFDPNTPHPDNAGSSDETIRSSAVPYAENYGYAAVRQIDLSLQWYYYDPTGYYGVTPSASVQGIAGYVSFSWDDDPHPYNDQSIVPEEARESPYPYGISLTNEDGEILEWTTEGTTYDAVADETEQALEDVGLGALTDSPATTGNIWEDLYNQMIDGIIDLFDFIGFWDEGIAETMREAFEEFQSQFGANRSGQ